jgi:hypothetical protein
MAKASGIIQWSTENGFAEPYEVDASHMSRYSCLGMRSALHHAGFMTPEDRWLEVWWTTDTRTGHVTDIFEDTRGLNFNRR